MRLLFPYPDLQRSADCLDPVLRWQSVLEARRLVGRPTAEWRRHVDALRLYVNYLLSAIYRRRERLVTGFGMYDLVDYRAHERRVPDPEMPPWLADRSLREADRAVLSRRLPIFYSQFGWDATPDQTTT